MDNDLGLNISLAQVFIYYSDDLVTLLLFSDDLLRMYISDKSCLNLSDNIRNIHNLAINEQCW